MINTGSGSILNRGLIRNFTYSNLPIHGVKIAPSNNGVLSAENNLPNIVQTFGANNIAKVQNMRGQDTYDNSHSLPLTINPSTTLNTENLNNINLNGVTINNNLIAGNAVNLTNVITLTSS